MSQFILQEKSKIPGEFYGLFKQKFGIDNKS